MSIFYYIFYVYLHMYPTYLPSEASFPDDVPDGPRSPWRGWSRWLAWWEPAREEQSSLYWCWLTEEHLTTPVLEGTRVTRHETYWSASISSQTHNTQTPSTPPYTWHIRLLLDDLPKWHLFVTFHYFLLSGITWRWSTSNGNITEAVREYAFVLRFQNSIQY